MSVKYAKDAWLTDDNFACGSSGSHLVVDEGAGDGVPDISLLGHALVHDCDGLRVALLACHLAGIDGDRGQRRIGCLERLQNTT